MNDDDSTELETLLFEALRLREERGPAALEEFVVAHPEQERKLRAGLAELQNANLLAPTRASLPEQLGEFVLGEQLGAGGMGVVLAATQRSLGREVAVKIVRPELLLFEGARERFRREIDAVARLEHPAIVPILATGESEELPWYAMPRLRGVSGDRVVDRFATVSEPGAAELYRFLLGEDERERDASKPMTGPWWSTIVEMLRHVALGIHHAHLRGVLHRDLKPSNVMLGPDGRAIVLDFGLAQARGDARLTRTGSAAGSPAFMSPEQVRGEPADERTDVYGLAATTLALLTRRRPFEGDDAEALRGKILSGVRIDFAAVPNAPKELEIVLACALDLERSRRYASALAFAEDLEAVLAGGKIRAVRLPWTVRARRFAKRRRTAVAVAGVVGLFLLIVPLLLLWQQHHANLALQGQVTRSDQSVEISIAAVDRMMADVARRKLRHNQSPYELSISLLEHSLTMFEQLEGDERYRERLRRHRCNALFELAKAHDAIGQVDRAERRCHELIEYVRAMDPNGSSASEQVAMLAANARTMLVQYALERGDLDQANRWLRESRQITAAYLELDPGNARALRERNRVLQFDAQLAERRQDFEGAERAYREAIDSADAAGAGSSKHTIAEQVRTHLAMFLRRHGRPDEATVLVDEVIERLTGRTDADCPWPVPRMVICTARNERFSMLRQAKRTREAVAEAKVLLAALDELVADYPDVTDARQLRGLVQGNLSLCYGKSQLPRVEQLTRAAIAEFDWVLERRPGYRIVQNWREQNLIGLCWALRSGEKWAELVPIARRLAETAHIPKSVRTAARDLLRSASSIAEQREQLREEAIVWFVRAAERGAPLRGGDPLYAPIRKDPRIVRLLTPQPKASKPENPKPKKQ